MQRALVLAALLAVPIQSGPAHAEKPARGLVASPPSRHVAPAPMAGSGARVRPEQVSIETDDEIVLVGSYYAPPRKQRSPAVLLVHDAGADRTQLDDIARRLNKQGFGVLSMDLRGHGETKTDDSNWEQLDEDKRAALWRLAPRDVEAASRWVLGRSEIHSTNLSLMGYRAGCALVVRHARHDENVICMSLLSPRPKDFGFDVERDIQELEGLPTQVIDLRNDETHRLVEEANAQTPQPWVELHEVPKKAETVLEDRKTASVVAKWMSNVAMPKRGS